MSAVRPPRSLNPIKSAISASPPTVCWAIASCVHVSARSQAVAAVGTELGRSKIGDYLEARVNKVLEGTGAAPVTVRMLFHGTKEFSTSDRLISKR